MAHEFEFGGWDDGNGGVAAATAAADLDVAAVSHVCARKLFAKSKFNKSFQICNIFEKAAAAAGKSKK